PLPEAQLDRFMMRLSIGYPSPESEAGILSTHGVASTLEDIEADRKSTRLNSSHGSISYAVFCLKKKKIVSYTFTRLYLSPHPQFRGVSCRESGGTSPGGAAAGLADGSGEPPRPGPGRSLWRSRV